MKNKIVWYLKQLLPLKYKSQFKAIGGDIEHLADVDGKLTCEWRMWFGRSFCEVYTAGWK